MRLNKKLSKKLDDHIKMIYPFLGIKCYDNGDSFKVCCSGIVACDICVEKDVPDDVKKFASEMGAHNIIKDMKNKVRQYEDI